jgi:Zn-finger nucleic acid-binding protein
MRCPACGRVLSTMTVGGITVDVCKDGCAGIWFDRYELMRVDESHESAGEELTHIEGDPAILGSLDHSKRHSCPKTPDVVMMRHYFSVKRQVAVDECPECGGYWLDVGELATIRTEFATSEERDRAAAQYFSDLFDSELAAAHAETQKDLERAQRVAYIFRFICPSYYIPGKQEWGAF